ncbi:MAG TPA: hypothetical protein VFV08_05165, partial [Puia sp.]|nr:hypothetical protein [Puia sp.]
ASWNFLLDKTYNTWQIPYCGMLNDDIYLGKFEHEIKDLIWKNPDESLLANIGDWCSFLLPYETFNRIGPFDEHFKTAYYEDNDYAYRLKIDGKGFFPTTGLAPIKMVKSGSIQRDAGLNRDFEGNKSYFIEKWGGMQGEETFPVPFNNSGIRLKKCIRCDRVIKYPSVYWDKKGQTSIENPNRLCDSCGNYKPKMQANAHL